MEETKSRELPIFAPWAIAIVGILVVTVLFLYSTKEPPSASGKITKIFALDIPGNTPRVLTGVEVHLKNETEKELLVRTVSSKLKTSSGENTDNPAAATEQARYFQAFPAFKQSNAPPLAFETKIPPHSEIDGLLVFGYPVSKSEFDQRSVFDITIQLYGRQPLVLKEKGQ